MKNANRYLVGLGTLALASACASSNGRFSKGDPFSDPSKFESLASNAYSMPATAAPPAPAPADLVAAVAPIVATKPVAVEPQKQLMPVMNSSMLFSSPLAYDPDAVKRAPASVVRSEEEAPTPDGAYTNLIRGNERFVNGTVKGDHRDEKRRRDLAAVQKPFAIVLSCSDSRVPPELIFDQGLGDLFTIRVAGNVLGSAQVASIEYAIEHLGAKLILVMGHESCGAVKAALAAPSAKKHAEAGSPDMDWLVGSIRPVLKSRGLASVTPDDPKIRKPVMANIDSVTESLLVRSKVVGEAIGKGNLKIVRGIYSLESGKVDFWGLK